MKKYTIEKLNIGDFIAVDFTHYEAGKMQLKAMEEYCKKHDLELRLDTEPFYKNDPHMGTQRVWKVFKKDK